MRRAFKTNKILQGTQIEWEDITTLKTVHTFYWGTIFFQHNRRGHWHILLILKRDEEFRRCIKQVLAFATIYDKTLPLTHCRGTFYPRSISKSVPLTKQRLNLSLMLWAERRYHHGRPFDSFRTLWAKVLKLCPLVMPVPTGWQLWLFQSRYGGLLKFKKKVILVPLQAWNSMRKQRARSSDS